jgi:rubrerythrin
VRVFGRGQAEAQAVLNGLLEEKRLADEEAARIAAEKAEEERVIKIREAAWKKGSQVEVKTHGETEEDREARKKKAAKEPERAEGTHEYECTQCGYTLFVAKGREFKFFPADYKCPQCGAGKAYFKDNAAEV